MFNMQQEIHAKRAFGEPYAIAHPGLYLFLVFFLLNVFGKMLQMYRLESITFHSSCSTSRKHRFVAKFVANRLLAKSILQITFFGIRAKQIIDVIFAQKLLPEKSIC